MIHTFITKLFLPVIIAVVIIALYGIASSHLYSQPKIGKITGTVVDKKTNAPIESADVMLYKQSDSSLVKGTQTDNSGEFTLDELQPGSFYLRANLVGYNFASVSGITINRDKKEIRLDPVKLGQGETTTEEIIVEGEKNLVEFRPDKKIFNVSKDATSQGGSLIDLLKNVPSVNVDQDGNVSLRGSEGVKILIDGKPFGLEGQARNTILEQIPASNVESIELITNPSAKYEAEGSAGIINIVLKKNENKGLGYNGVLGLNMGTGDRYSGQFSFALKNNKVNLYGNYGYDIRNNKQSGYSERLYLGGISDIGEIIQDVSGNRRNKSHMIKLGLDYSMDQRNSLGISLRYRKSDKSSGSISDTKEFGLNGSALSDYFSTSNESETGYSFDFNSNYMLRFKNPQQVLTAEISYSKDHDDELEENYDTYITPVNNTPDKRNEHSDELQDAFTGKLDYAHPISKDIKIETGYRGSYKKLDNDFTVDIFDYNNGQFVTDYNQSNRFIYKEQVHALYGIYTQQIGDFGFSLGGRVEQTVINGELANTLQNFDRNYIDFFPSASISQKFGKTNELQISYSRRINRPRQRQINPFRSLRSGSNDYFEGNPNINPEFTDSYQLDFITFFPWATITPGIFYRYTRDEISRQRTLLDSVSTLTTFVNLNSSKSYGGELLVNTRPVKFLNITGTFSYFRTEVDAGNLQAGLSNGATTWSTRGVASLTLPMDFGVQMSYFYTGKRVAAQGTIDPFQAFDISLKKDLFDKKLSLSLRASDVFNTAKFRMNFDDVYFREYAERMRDSRGLYLNITYNFGQQEKDKKRDRKKGDENNTGEEDFDF
jgi:outer membrane receptor protein involved in Fe transport